MSAYDKIELMNQIIGNPTPSPDEEGFWEGVSNQASYILEEAKELIEETTEKNLENTVKELSDVLVVALGLYQRLADGGVDVGTSLDAVCDNNLQKFHTDPEHARETVQFYMDKGVETYVRTTGFEDGTEYYAVIRKSDNKLMKPHDFTKVSLSSIVEKVNERTE